MLSALVVGTATATVKHASLRGRTLLLVQPRRSDGGADGDPLLAVDGLGAGIGEIVIITSDGRGARELLKTDVSPVRWTTVGIQDA